MSKLSFVHPIDQPSGTFRLIDWLEKNFLDSNYQNFRCLIAFAKIKPFYKLHSAIQTWNNAGKTSEAIIGIDHKGTSYQALQYLQEFFMQTTPLFILSYTYSMALLKLLLIMVRVI